MDIEHTFIGDLVVSVRTPTGIGSPPISRRHTMRSTRPASFAPKGKSPLGTWTLVVEDKERLDTGKIGSSHER